MTPQPSPLGSRLRSARHEPHQDLRLSSKNPAWTACSQSRRERTHGQYARSVGKLCAARALRRSTPQLAVFIDNSSAVAAHRARWSQSGSAPHEPARGCAATRTARRGHPAARPPPTPPRASTPLRPHPRIASGRSGRHPTPVVPPGRPIVVAPARTHRHQQVRPAALTHPLWINRP
jgi:hypothetical protein